MRKLFVVSILVLLASTLLLASGQARVDFVNHTSSTLRFSIDGNAACAGDVIPNGTCTDYASVGTHTLRAVEVNDNRNSVSATRDLDDSEPYTWVVSEQ
jgi:hypothetical protein